MKTIQLLKIFSVLVIFSVIFSSCKKDYELTTMSGTIINSQTGSGLAGATLSFYESADKSRSNEPLFVVVTDASGNFTTNEAFVGTFKLVITAVDFIDLTIDNFVISADMTLNDFQQITLVKQLGTDGVLRVVLTWGETPYDLDSHLTGPLAGSSDRFHMSFMDEIPDNSNVNLDVDDTGSYGPETTTIVSYTDGVYRYSIHNYSNSTESGAIEIYNSPAVVSVYNSTGLVKTYTAPSTTATSGDTWVVFEINVSGGVANIVDKNTYYLAGDASSVTKSVKKN
jgi:hypothetical protein